MGTAHRHLDVPGETKFAGKGVSYCASCDGFFYRGKTVAVIGGNDSAVGAAVYLADITNKVYLVYRKDGLRAEKFWVESAEKNPKIEIIYNTNVIEIKGKDRLEELVLDNPHNGAASLKADGLFIEIGADPNSELMAVLGVALDDSRHVKINAEGMTNVEGVWAAGDITDGSNKFKQIVTAAAEGATAAFSIQRYLKKK
jgi:thioredoxin reductase (NADPH)